MNSILTAAISNSSLNKNSSKAINTNFFCKSDNSYPPEIQSESNSFSINDKKHEILADKNSNSIKQSILKRQKSASTEFLNLIKPLEENSSNSVSSSNKNELNSDSNKKSNNLIENQTKRNNSPRLSPNPPQIQQISGVLSKSLCSIVHKPQPLKPKINSSIINSTNNIDKVSPGSSSSSGQTNSNTSNTLLRNSTVNKSLLKNKCVSTTNLRFESLVNSSFSMYGEDKKINKSNQNIKKPANKVSSKSVSFLNKIEKSDETNEYDFDFMLKFKSFFNAYLLFIVIYYGFSTVFMKILLWL